MRSQIDIGYRIEKQSVFIFEIRPDWMDPKKKVENDIAKATYVQKDDQWKVFWQKPDSADLKSPIALICANVSVGIHLCPQ